MSKRTIELYVDDIKSSIQKIINYTRNLTFADFRKDVKTVDAVIRNLEIIGEAAKKIPEPVRKKYPNIPWRQMIALRNKILHEYFGVDIMILWQTVSEDIPNLKKEIKSL